MKHDGFSTIQPAIAANRVKPEMKVTRWMSKNVFATSPDSALFAAVDLMNEHRIRHIPVVDGLRLVGIISDRDVRNALPRGTDLLAANDGACKASLKRLASEVMSKHPITIPIDFSIHEAAEIMCREKISALPIMDDGRMVGIISAEDLLWALMQITGDKAGSDR
jgi:acetoin utilization protein AcuB